MQLFARNMRTLCYHIHEKPCDTEYVMSGVPGTCTRRIRIISLNFDAYVLALCLRLVESYTQNRVLFHGACEASPVQRYGHL